MPDFLRSPLGHTLGIDLNSLSKFSARSTQFSEGIGLLSNVRSFWDDTNAIYMYLHLFDQKKKLLVDACSAFKKCDTYFHTYNNESKQYAWS